MTARAPPARSSGGSATSAEVRLAFISDKAEFASDDPLDV